MSEVAREYLADRATYLPSDLLAIARRTLANEAEQGRRSAVCDTDLQTICIWWQERYGPVPRWLSEAYAGALAERSRIYLLCRPDIPWQSDPQREHPYDRDRLFELYLADLEARNATYRIVEGDGEQRVSLALDHIRRITSQAR